MATELFHKITGKDKVFYTSRCNDAINLALSDAKSKGKSKVIMFTVGQWVSYDQLAEELGLVIVKIENPGCKIDYDLLEKHLDSNSVLIMHSLSAYYYPQPMKEIYELCQSKNALLINDCCGSIGFSFLLHGDYLVCSFGRWKPLTIGTGGILATDFAISTESVDLPIPDLVEKIQQLPTRIEKLNDKCLAIIADLLLDNLHPLNKTEEYNLVVLCPFNSENEKAKILAICKNHQVEYKECPFMIRSEKQAISIEVKRLDI